MPSAGQLMRARKRFAALLPDRATIERPVTAYDGAGGHSTTWPAEPLAEDVPCRLSPVGGGEDQAGSGDRIAAEATATITFAAGTDVADTDRVTIGAQAFDVLLVRLRGEYEMTRRVEAKESS